MTCLILPLIRVKVHPTVISTKPKPVGSDGKSELLSERVRGLSIGSVEVDTCTEFNERNTFAV